jgi:hypothetical protein
MDTQLVQTETGIHLAFPTPADGTSVAGVLRTTDMRRGSTNSPGSVANSGVAVSIMTLCKTIIGSGLLGLPYALAQTGLILGTVLLVLVGAVQAFVLHLLAVCVKVGVCAAGCCCWRCCRAEPGATVAPSHPHAVHPLHRCLPHASSRTALYRTHGTPSTFARTRRPSTASPSRQACHRRWWRAASGSPPLASQRPTCSLWATRRR